MAEQNPIRYQDLISPDDSIVKLIAQLDELNDAYNAMANSVKSQAASLAASLKSVSGATSAGRTATMNAANDADKLAKAYQNLAFARSETAKKIAELKMAQQEENRVTKLQIILNNTEEGSYAHLSAQYSLNKMQLNQLTAAERENLPHAKKLEEETKAIYEEMKRLQEATGKYSLNVGNYTNAINDAIGVNSNWFAGLQQIGGLFEGGFANGLKTAGSAVAAFGKQLLALLTNPVVLAITATIAAVTAALAALSKGISSSEENTNAFNRVLAPFKRILEGALNVIQNFATMVLKVVEGFENLAMAASKLMEKLPFVGDAMKKVNRELEKSIELEREKQALQKDGRKLTVQEAKTQYEIAVLRRKANQTDDPQQRAALLQKAVNKENQIANNRMAYIKRELNVLRERARITQNDSKLNDEIAQKEAELWQVRTQAEQRSLRMVRQIATAERQLNGGGAAKDTSGVDLAKQQLEEQRQLEDARIALIQDASLRERMVIIASYDRKIEDLKGSEEYITQMRVLLEQQKQYKLADLYEKEAKQAADAEQKNYEERLKIADEMVKQRIDAVKREEAAINQQYELSMSFADLEDSEKKKTEMRLKAEKERLQALLALYEKDGKTLTAAELRILKNNISAVDKELTEAKKSTGDIYDLFGFNMTDEKKEAIDTALSYSMEALNQWVSGLAEAADRERELADAQVDRAQNVLETELEARANGYANDVETARKELELAKKNQQKAIEQQKQAQKVQIALDTASQAANLITASSLIWKQLGFPWAIPALAVMWGSFAAAKIKAVQAVSAGTEKYAEGTVELLEGGSHQSGNDIDLGTKSNGTRRRAEGGEYFAVINKRNSRKYRDVIPDVINSLNQGTFAEKYLNAYDGGGFNVVAPQGANLSKLEAGVDRINNNLEKPTTYVDGNGNMVTIYKNVKRVIKN